MWGGSGEAVSKLVGNGQRPEGPQLIGPARQAGKGFVNEMSTEGAAQQRVSRLQRSSNPPNLSRPDGPGLLIVGPLDLSLSFETASLAKPGRPLPKCSTILLLTPAPKKHCFTTRRLWRAAPDEIGHLTSR
jgi:hypothetical protein